jgi:hypothetical protein
MHPDQAMSSTPRGLGNVGASLSGPKVASPVENELSSLGNSTEQLSDVVNTLFSRLSPLLRNVPGGNASTGKEAVELSPIPQVIRQNREKVMMNVFAIRELLERLEL